jgi:hypothetical protein
MMKLTTCALPLFLFLMSVPAHAATTTDPCALPIGLFARRQALKQQYSEQVRSGYLSHKEAADHILAQLTVVDQHYRALLSTLCGAASDGDADVVDRCCGETDHDPLAGEMCNLAHYLADEREAKHFVQNFPETPQKIAIFWDLDEVSYGRQGLLVKECGPIGGVDLYVDKLFNLAVLGDQQALEKFVNLTQHAEGEFAEGLGERMKRLFVENPRLVLEQWSVIRRDPHIQYVASDFVDDNEQATAERNFHKLCIRPSQACAEIERAISAPRD